MHLETAVAIRSRLPAHLHVLRHPSKPEQCLLLAVGDVVAHVPSICLNNERLGDRFVAHVLPVRLGLQLWLNNFVATVTHCNEHVGDPVALQLTQPWCDAECSRRLRTGWEYGVRKAVRHQS